MPGRLGATKFEPITDDDGFDADDFFDDDGDMWQDDEDDLDDLLETGDLDERYGVGMGVHGNGNNLGYQNGGGGGRSGGGGGWQGASGYGGNGRIGNDKSQYRSVGGDMSMSLYDDGGDGSKRTMLRFVAFFIVCVLIFSIPGSDDGVVDLDNGAGASASTPIVVDETTSTTSNATSAVINNNDNNSLAFDDDDDYYGIAEESTSNSNSNINSEFPDEDDYNEIYDDDLGEDNDFLDDVLDDDAFIEGGKYSSGNDGEDGDGGNGEVDGEQNGGTGSDTSNTNGDSELNGGSEENGETSQGGDEEHFGDSNDVGYTGGSSEENSEGDDETSNNGEESTEGNDDFVKSHLVEGEEDDLAPNSKDFYDDNIGDDDYDQGQESAETSETSDPSSSSTTKAESGGEQEDNPSTAEECIDGYEQIAWEGIQRQCSWLRQDKNIVICAKKEDFQRVCRKTCGICEVNKNQDDNNQNDDGVNNEDLGTEETEPEAEGSDNTSTEEECIDGDEKIQWKEGLRSCSWLSEDKNIVHCAQNEDFQRICKKTCGVCETEDDEDNEDKEESDGVDTPTGGENVENGGTTATPTASPTSSPTIVPTLSPTASPTIAPTPSPTASPSLSPTKLPTISPTSSPSKHPTKGPTASPTIGTEEDIAETGVCKDEEGDISIKEKARNCAWVDDNFRYCAFLDVQTFCKETCGLCD